jgi:hypothetical protein
MAKTHDVDIWSDIHEHTYISSVKGLLHCPYVCVLSFNSKNKQGQETEGKAHDT